MISFITTIVTAIDDPKYMHSTLQLNDTQHSLGLLFSCHLFCTSHNHLSLSICLPSATFSLTIFCSLTYYIHRHIPHDDL